MIFDSVSFKSDLLLLVFLEVEERVLCFVSGLTYSVFFIATSSLLLASVTSSSYSLSAHGSSPKAIWRAILSTSMLSSSQRLISTLGPSSSLSSWTCFLICYLFEELIRSLLLYPPNSSWNETIISPSSSLSEELLPESCCSSWSLVLEREAFDFLMAFLDLFLVWSHHHL